MNVFLIAQLISAFSSLSNIFFVGRSWEKKKTPTPQTTSSGQNNTVNELFKMSHGGYSAPVSTWNGTRSQLDKEVNNERREERKRTLAPDSSDQGRAKHIKTSSSFKSNPGYNPIQVGNYDFSPLFCGIRSEALRWYVFFA